MPRHRNLPAPRLGLLVASVALVGSSGVAVAAGATPQRPTGCGGAATYLVSRGDTWFGIARESGVSVRALLAANDAAESRVIHPGETLCLPGGATVRSNCSPSNAPTRTVQRNDTWFGIARSSGVTVRALLEANRATESRILHPGDVLCLPRGATPASGSGSASTGSTPTSSSSSSSAGTSGGAATYTVARNDSWFSIARRAQVTIRALTRANDTTTDRMLRPGDVLRLPAGAAPIAGSTRPTGTPLAALPVQGPCSYTDTWHHPRGGGRLHVGVDLFAHTGQYVYAVVDGTLTGRAWDRPGLRAGNAWWLTAGDGSGTRFFYAHLVDFAPDLQVGSRVRAGQIIGWVGSTGNASFPHLHFEIHPNGGRPINPYPIVHAAGGCNRGTPYQQPGGWVPPVLRR